MQLTGAQIILKCLEDEGVDTIYGYPGGAVLPLYDAIETDARSLVHYLVRQEAAAVHAAEGYARASGKVGVALVTSGPGATNAVTGIANAYMDSTPLVVISGQVPTAMIGLDAFQEIDTVGITRPATKHNFLVKDVEDLEETLKKAFLIASSGRPGPVLVDIPKDVQNASTEYKKLAQEDIQIRSYKPKKSGHPRQIKKAVELLYEASRPIIYVGGGVTLDNASDELIQFAETLGYPVTQTLMSLGAFPSSDEQFIGMLGMHGTYEANMAMHKADLVIAVGARFDDRVTGDVKKFCPDARVIQIDIDPTSIDKNIVVDVPIVGPVKQVLAAICDILKTPTRNADELKQWWQQIADWRKIDSLGYQKSKTTIKPQEAIECLWKVTNGDAFISSDVGQHQMYAAQYYRFNKPRRWVNSGGLGTMGFGLPAAMGIQRAFPDEAVAVVTGDGSIQMNIQELSTCKQYGWPIKVINLNNGYLGMVRQWQEFFYDGRYAMSYMESLPNFVKLAEAYGHVGMSVTDPADLESAMREAFSLKDRLVFMDIAVDAKENVYPMIPAGAGHSEMILEKND